jgi:hypothetical protein
VVRRIIGAAVGSALILMLTASVAFAGEITGNGRSLHVDGGG